VRTLRWSQWGLGQVGGFVVYPMMVSGLGQVGWGCVGQVGGLLGPGEWLFGPGELGCLGRSGLCLSSVRAGECGSISGGCVCACLVMENDSHLLFSLTHKN
jgi:hypothetical protein